MPMQLRVKFERCLSKWSEGLEEIIARSDLSIHHLFRPVSFIFFDTGELSKLVC